MDSAITADRARPETAARTRTQFDARFDTPANRRMARLTGLFVGIVVLGGLFYAFSALLADLQGAHERSWGPFILFGVALLIALGFEFVNGFHDTANAVATVIYTHALPPNIAVVWSGFFNFLGVLTSTGAVAFGIISLLPVELIPQVSNAAGFAMCEPASLRDPSELWKIRRLRHRSASNLRSE